MKYKRSAENSNKGLPPKPGNHQGFLPPKPGNQPLNHKGFLPPKYTWKSLIDKERERRFYFISIQIWLRQNGERLGFSSGSMDSIMCRFIFTRRVFARDSCCDDSLFFASNSKCCTESQLAIDYCMPEFLLKGLQLRIHRAQRSLRRIATPEIGKATKEQLKELAAMRYEYFFPQRLSLCRPYADMKWKPDEATEAFATSRDHYFDHYCTPFPDLDVPLGSLGSFFDQTWDSWPTQVIHVNPPFAKCIYRIVIQKIESWLTAVEENQERQLTFIVVFPDWHNWSLLDYLKDRRCEWVRDAILIPAEKSIFINSHSKEPESGLTTWEIHMSGGSPSVPAEIVK